jgi:UDP-N-acetylglucosamine 2-epimerase
MLKVMIVVGTRPEIIRLSRVIDKIDSFCRLLLVHTGQNFDYELNEVFFSDLNIRRPDVFLDAAGETPAETIGQVIVRVDRAFAEHEPDALLILGDTNSALAAIAAKRRKIPIFHMEAGNRCYDFRVPEEINRRIIDHTADINMPYTEIARENLLREGLPSDQVLKTGSPMREVLEYHRERIDASDVLTRLGLREQSYFVVSSHREENVDSTEQLQRFVSILHSLADRFQLPVIVSTHPRTRKRLDALGVGDEGDVKFMKPFGFLDYVRLQVGARCVLSDSGTITEESSIMNFPALNLREAHERPEGFEEGAVMFVGLNVSRIHEALAVLAQQPRGADRLLRLVNDYAPRNVSDKVLRIVMSYTDFVNRKVWQKPSVA